MFSKTCEYAIRAMMFIAHKSDSGLKVGVREISAGTLAPEHFIAKILQQLCRKGFVQSVKGPNGGFYLDELSRKRCVADIVRAIDGDKLFIGCGLGLKNCSEKKPCPLHDEFKLIRKQIGDMLRSMTVGEYNEDLMQGLKYLKR
jgi:Rrf2 family protein